jgi:hypothetical protein
MMEKVIKLKMKVCSILGLISKLPSAPLPPLPMMTGWIVRKIRMDMKVRGTLMKLRMA